jgi:hypothetical protein
VCYYCTLNSKLLFLAYINSPTGFQYDDSIDTYSIFWTSSCPLLYSLNIPPSFSSSVWWVSLWYLHNSILFLSLVSLWIPLDSPTGLWSIYDSCSRLDDKCAPLHSVFLFFPGWPQKKVLPISASQAKMITDMSHWCPASIWHFEIGLSHSTWWSPVHSFSC